MKNNRVWTTTSKTIISYISSCFIGNVTSIYVQWLMKIFEHWPQEIFIAITLEKFEMNPEEIFKNYKILVANIHLVKTWYSARTVLLNIWLMPRTEAY